MQNEKNVKFIGVRMREDEVEWVEREAARATERNGFRVTKSDIIRRALSLLRGKGGREK